MAIISETDRSYYKVTLWGKQSVHAVRCYWLVILCRGAGRDCGSLQLCSLWLAGEPGWCTCLVVREKNSGPRAMVHARTHWKACSSECVGKHRWFQWSVGGFVLVEVTAEEGVPSIVLSHSLGRNFAVAGSLVGLWAFRWKLPVKDTFAPRMICH